MESATQITVDYTHYSAEEIYQWFRRKVTLTCSAEVLQEIQKGRTLLKNILDGKEKAYYGINTGFGSLCNVRISPEQLSDLQHNLLLSHACGVGSPIPKEIAQLMLLLKILSLRHPSSGIRPVVIQKLVELYNRDLIPVIYEYGSLGASGDLAPLAHLSLPLIGMGEIWDGKQIRRFEPSTFDFQPLKLQAKEGLALLNGTQFTLAYAIIGYVELHKILHASIMTAALSMEAFQCDIQFLDPYLHQQRPHPGQKYVAKQLRNWLKNSDLPSRKRYAVQDPYSFRCVPQVLGPIYEILQFSKNTIDIEINSVTDNPIADPNTSRILSGGNFHAQPLGLLLDYLAVAASELANISERRTFQLLSGTRDLPPYLTPNPGLESGLMIAQYSGAALVRQLKLFAHPATTDSIVTSNGQEDHVSMAAHAGLKLYKMLPLLRTVIAIEWMCAAQALHFRHAQLSPPLRDRLHQYRQNVPPLLYDRILHDEVRKTVDFLFA